MNRKEAKDLSGQLVAVRDPSSAAAEAYRGLRTNLIYASADNPPKTVLLTSPGPREGKSTSCANLGVSLARAEQKTLIIDCNQRAPVMHKIFGADSFTGLANALVKKRDLHDVTQSMLPYLDLVAAGPTTPDPAELLASRPFSELIARARQDYDYVLLDAPPVNSYSDPAILAPQVDGVLLVFDARKTRRKTLLYSVRTLEAVGANILGSITNNTKGAKGSGLSYASGQYRA